MHILEKKAKNEASISRNQKQVQQTEHKVDERKKEQKLMKLKRNIKQKKINKAKTWFFGGTNKSDKPLARMIRKGRSTSYQYKKKFKGDITTDL